MAATIAVEAIVDQRGDQRDAALDDQCARRKGHVSGQYVRQHGAESCRGGRAQRMHQKGAQQDNAVAEIGIAARGGDGDGKEHGGHADQRGKERSDDDFER